MSVLIGCNMAKEFAKKFYESKSWKQVRDSVLKENYGMCSKCNQRPAEIVHHIIWLNAKNINDPYITLGRDNLMPVCRVCHSLIHEGTGSTTEEVIFDSNGDVIKRCI